MTPVERGLDLLRDVLGERLVGHIRANLPSRKPQLWERLARGVLRRAQMSWQIRSGTGSSPVPIIVTLPQFDILMECSPRERVMDLPLFLFGVYEIAGTRFLQRVLGRGAIVIDVGANSGYFSLVAARLTGQHGRVYAFEPVSGPYERLQRNLYLNGLQNVIASRAVVGRGIGRSIVYPSTLASNDGLGSVIPGRFRSAIGEEVPMISLDHVMRLVPGGRVDLVKVDVEGAEAEVFAGAAALLRKPDAPVLLFESFNVDLIEKSLAEFGYEVRSVHYSLQNGLEFPRVGEPFDNSYGAYEAPNFVALKPSGKVGSFQEISVRSRREVPALLRLIARLA